MLMMNCFCQIKFMSKILIASFVLFILEFIWNNPFFVVAKELVFLVICVV